MAEVSVVENRIDPDQRFNVFGVFSTDGSECFPFLYSFHFAKSTVMAGYVIAKRPIKRTVAKTLTSVDSFLEALKAPRLTRTYVVSAFDAANRTGSPITFQKYRMV